jgi:hypothetical protein
MLGVTSMDLVVRCQIDFLDKNVQPFFTVVYACPGKDYIRLWPLPVMQPWFEDWHDTPATRDDLMTGIVFQHLLLR